MAFKDGNLSLDELNYVIGGLDRGKKEEMLNNLDKKELLQLKQAILQKQNDNMSLDELTQVKAGVPISSEEAKSDLK